MSRFGFAVAAPLGLGLLLSAAMLLAAERITHAGTIARVSETSLTLKEEGKSVSLAVDVSTKVTVDGATAQIGDLKVGFRATCLCEKGKNKLMVVSISATNVVP